LAKSFRQYFVDILTAGGCPSDILPQVDVPESVAAVLTSPPELPPGPPRPLANPQSRPQPTYRMQDENQAKFDKIKTNITAYFEKIFAEYQKELATIDAPKREYTKNDKAMQFCVALSLMLPMLTEGEKQAIQSRIQATECGTIFTLKCQDNLKMAIQSHQFCQALLDGWLIKSPLRKLFEQLYEEKMIVLDRENHEVCRCSYFTAQKIVESDNPSQSHFSLTDAALKGVFTYFCDHVRQKSELFTRQEEPPASLSP